MAVAMALPHRQFKSSLTMAWEQLPEPDGGANSAANIRWCVLKFLDENLVARVEMVRNSDENGVYVTTYSGERDLMTDDGYRLLVRGLYRRFKLKFDQSAVQAMLVIIARTSYPCRF